MTLLNVIVDLAYQASHRVETYIKTQPENIQSLFHSGDMSQVKFKLNHNEYPNFSNERAVIELNITNK